MRRAPFLIAIIAVAALGGVWAASVVAPCALPPALMMKIAPAKAASCPAPARPPRISRVSSSRRR